MEFGSFSGLPTVTLLDDGRRVKLAAPFGFVDSKSVEWNVPIDAIVDGASIPRALWTLMGGPFEGKYRHASIVHDWYCDLRTRSWQAVHQVFYEGMRASGVSRPQALLLYGGVYWGGPRWSTTVVENTNLLTEYLEDSKPGSPRVHYPMPVDEFGVPVRKGPYAERVVVRKFRFDLTDEDVLTLQREFTARDITTPEQVTAAVDEHLQKRESNQGSDL